MNANYSICKQIKPEILFLLLLLGLLISLEDLQHYNFYNFSVHSIQEFSCTQPQLES